MRQNNPKRVLVVGALGKMGERVRAAVSEESQLCVGAGLERAGHPGLGTALAEGGEVTADPEQALAASDVVIDFSVPDSSLALLRLAADQNIPSVIGTTGFSPAQREEIGKLTQKAPVVLAPNFSVAVNVLGFLTRKTAELLGDGYDAEIVEVHHSAKRDAPSGTAIWLGEQLAAGRNQELKDVATYARHGEIGARPKGEIGLQTLRGGDVAGEHTVYFFGEGERLELIHRASTRDHFARGAVRAALWLLGRKPGLYAMDQVLGLDRL